jgi:hypothetical protein
VQQRKERANPPHTQQQGNKGNKGPVSKTTNETKRTTRVRLVTRRTLSCRIYSTTHHNERCRGHREGESTLTVCHSCHRPRNPVGHVLIEHRCAIKHCKKRRCNKEKKDQPTTNNETKKVKQQNNKTCENCDPMKLELSYMYMYIRIAQ